ncbi:hypothetical protein M569_15326, partial [Genlisea aurea]
IMWDSETDSGNTAAAATAVGAGNGILPTSKTSLRTDGFEQKGQSWFVATDIPSDLLVQIGDVNFHLHKYPLVSRSGKMNRIVYESQSNTDLNKLILDDLPGGAESFELAARFCYGIPVDLTPTNISGLRCAAEYLEMTEDLEEGNLIFKTEAFLSYVVLSSWRDSIVVLKSCENLSPWAENLQIVRRCSESIAWKACANPKGIRWPYTGKPPRVSSPKWTDTKESSPNRAPPDWWFEDASILRIDHFVRVITAIKVKGMRHELIGAVIMHYAGKWLPFSGSAVAAAVEESDGGAWKGGLHMIVAGTREEHGQNVSAAATAANNKDQRMIVESLISIIPPQKDSVSCSFLLRLLRMASMVKVAPALVTELEKRVGMQLEQAALNDLLIPSYYSKGETTYDVDLVQRLLEHFLMQEQSEVGGSPGGGGGNSSNAKMRVARLVDSYLTEVSRDRNLSLTKFQVLAEALPESARTSDDGLYRAVDSYLKAHPGMTEHERKRLCRVMDSQKLSIDACMHAAQNERLPLRVVVQVLFAELVKVNNSLAAATLKDAAAAAAAGESQLQPMVSSRKTLLEGTPQSFQEGWATAKKDINTLKFELETVKAKYLELQNEFETFQRQVDKSAPKAKTTSSAWWTKLGKLTNKAAENDAGGRAAAAPNGEQIKKGPRRWRNSIS